jgi:glycosyltransferase involved in cell wall biosynthesis
MASMPTVSVIIPTYNRKDLVIEAIESVFAQTYRDYEIVLVDDGSTDDTEQAVRSSFKDRVRYLSKANGGVSSARNLGIQRAQGSLIAFLDSDDVWEPSFLEITAGYLAHHEDVGMVSTGWRTLPSGHRWPPMRKRVLHGCLLPFLMQEDLVRTSAVLARRNALLEAGLFNERLEVAEDTDMWLKIAARHPTAILNIHLSWGRRHDLRLSKNRILHLQQLLQVFEAHYDPRLVKKKIFDHRRSRLYLGLGERHLRAHNLIEAKACLTKAVALKPFSFRARRYLLKALIAQRQYSPQH